MQKLKFSSLVMAFMLISAISLKAQNDARLLRFPDINNDLIAFVYAGDIWTVSTNGGDAIRLTSHKGLELFPKISPDGQWIAFSAEYSGSRQVYVMPSTGGTPKQLTYYNDVGEMPPRGGWDNVILDWTPDSKNVLVRMNRTPFGERNGKYYLVNINGGLEKPLQIMDGGFGVLSPDAKRLAFAPISREFRTWKRYKGGRAADIWIYDLENDMAEKITDFVGTDQIPVWYKNKIYFASDRDLKLNIYSYDLETKETKQITSYSEYDVMWPSGESGMIAYENGGYIYKLNLETGKTEKVTVNIHFDNPNIIPVVKNVSEFIESAEISPTGKRAIFDARGDIFTVPAESGFTINLTKTQGIREMSPSWSPNGKYISYLSDATGEYEIYLLENKEGAKAKQITFNSKAWIYDPLWSPDSKYLLFFDRTLNLKYLNISSGEVKVITHAVANEIRDYGWSPDSRWVIYTNDNENSNTSIWVYNLSTGKNQRLTNDTFNDFSPVFSKDGNYIFFLSNRDFNLDFSSFEFTYLYNKATRVYALALRKDSPKLFKFKNDVVEVKTDMEETSSKDKKSKDEETKGLTVTIDFDGIESRIMDFPIADGDYGFLDAIEGGILYGAEDGLHKYDITDEKDELIISDVRWAIQSADGKKLLYRAKGNWGIVGISPKQKAGDGKLDLSDVEMKIDPKKEWQQIYIDGWRIFRDYFYVSNLHNVDWNGLKERYGKLVPYVSHRADLDYIFGEIIAESNTGHSYDNYGDFERVKRIDGGMLGAEFKADPGANRYKISKIYQGENWSESRRSPLTEQGINVKEGDYLISLNGNNVTLADNPYLYLENAANKYIEIKVNSTPSETGARTYTVKTIKSELSLFYFDWVNKRRKMVEELSGGRIGYIHVPNTSFSGNYELHRGMYEQHNKEALIIDDRYNGGGFIPENMADMLDRKTLSYWYRNGLEQPMKSPTVAHDGPKVMLINGYSSSGGDAFPYYFKKKGLGTLIGTRTWGGLVGISGNAGFVDGGSFNVPRFGVYDENGEWIIEGVGVYPDIEVVDKPDLIAKGIDPCIEKAVEVLLKELEENPVKKPKTPELPDRSGWVEKDVK